VLNLNPMKIRAGSVCDRGLNPRRSVNEDRFLSLPELGLFAVFDGVGGQRAGEVASQIAAETIKDSLEGEPLLAESVRRAIEIANRRIFEQSSGDSSYRTMATTVALLGIAGDRAIIAHVGDSRVYRLDGGQLLRETIDHTDLYDQARAGLITEEEAASKSDASINRALGAAPSVEIEIKTTPIGRRARFLLCTDGIHRLLSDQQIARALAIEDPQLAAEKLKQMAYERGSDDNLTALVIQVGQPEAAPQTPSYIEVPLAEPPPTSDRRMRAIIDVPFVLVLVVGAFHLGLRWPDIFSPDRLRERRAVSNRPRDSIQTSATHTFKRRPAITSEPKGC
jgi:serine/threonine protein phosphatase PrpC